MGGVSRGVIAVLCSLAWQSAGAGESVDRQSPQTPPASDLVGVVETEAEGPGTSATWRSRERLLGDLGGVRPWLEGMGLSLEITSVDEGMGSCDDREGSGAARHYAGLTDLVLTLDTGAAGWWRGGRFVVDLQNVRGGDLSEVVGDLQGVSNIVGPPGTRFAEYHLVQELAGGRLTVKLGKQDANADFVVSDGGGELVNSSFGLVPTVPLPTYPAPALGAMAAWSAHDRVLVSAGVWDGTPVVGSGCLETAFGGAGGAVGAVGVEIRAFGSRILPGTYRVGVWRHSEVEVTTTGKSPATVTTGAAAGLYLTADQELWVEGDRRLALFAQAGWGETDRSAVSRYFGGGLTLRSPLRGRPDDLVGLGVAHADLGELERADPGCTSETVVELLYRFTVTGWMAVSPDLQWVSRPGGHRDRSAFVAGLRVTTVF